MPTVNFEVTSYEIKIAREMNGSSAGLSLKFTAYIVCRGAEYHAVVYVLDDTSPVPANTFLPEFKRGTIFVPRWQFEWFRDLVRHEKPVHCFLSSDTPKWNSLYTGAEPTGESETEAPADGRGRGRAIGPRPRPDTTPARLHTFPSI
jgi:hypothetical protein